MAFIGRKPTNAPLTSSDLGTGIVGSTNIADGTIVNDDINASAAIAVSKLTGTLPTTKGGTGLAALGTANQVLAVNSGASALEFQSVSSDFVKLATTAITANTASVSFDGYFSSTYKNYIFIGSHLKNDADAYLRMRYRQSNANVTSSDYVHSQKTHRITSGAAVDDSNGGIESFFRLTNTNTVAAARAINFQFFLFDPLNTSYYKYYLGSSHHLYSDPTEYFYFHQIGGTFIGNTTALSGVTFFMNSGNLDDGSISLYGIKH